MHNQGYGDTHIKRALRMDWWALASVSVRTYNIHAYKYIFVLHTYTAYMRMRRCTF